ncbi:tetratricopeptide repeat protein [Archangium violaceum]|uniref:tetratricopeptide repeat protein n=1 Tax=Archangium violaceum TaxID=83451 RepID=UPI001F46C318|nr:tetratricopeptide repeat protein [Archangium violaceum]
MARLLNQKVMTWEGLELQWGGFRTRAVGVLDLCIEQFARGSVTRRLLEAIAVFTPEVGIERSWLGKTVEDEPWRALERLGLIQLQGEIAFIHGGTHQRVRVLAAPDDWKDAVRRVLERVRERLIVYRERGAWMEAEAAIADRFHLEAILRTAESLVPAMFWAEVAWLFAECLLRARQHGMARPLLFRALRLLERLPDADLELRASVRMSLAEVLEAIEDRGSARRLLEQAVAEDGKNAGVQPAQKADRLSRLASLQWEWGMRGRHSKRKKRWGAALQSIDRALDIDRNELGWSHVQLPSRLMLRGRILLGLGRVAEANAVLEEALSVGELVLGPDDLGLVTVLEALATARTARDDDTSALRLLERAVDISLHRLGEHHLETAYLLTELARGCARFGERVRARLHAERALAILEKGSSPSDPQLLRGLLRIAEVLAEVGERTAAGEILERALALQEAAAVPDFMELKVLVEQALFLELEDEGQRTVTDVLLSRVLELARRAPLGGQFERSRLEDFVSTILRSRQATPSSDTPVPFLAPTAGAAAGPLTRALALLSSRDTSESEKSRVLRQAIEEARQGDDPSNGARAFFLLADLEGRRGAWEKARESAGQGLQLALRAGVPGLVAEGYRLLADAALHGSYYEEARMSYEEAVRRYDVLGDRLRAARTRALLVALLLQLGRHDEAAAHVRWMREHLADPVLTQDARHDMQEILRLVERRTLSSQGQGARQRTP